MYKIAVMGEKESVMGFAAMGLSAFPVTNAEEAEKTLKKLAKSEEYAVIYVTETFAKPLAGEIAQYKDQIVPAIILIPGIGESSGIGKQALSDAVIKAVGAEIL